jgi:hypothetical protein
MRILRSANRTYVAVSLATVGLAALVWRYLRRRGRDAGDWPVSLQTSIRIEARPADVFAAWLDTAREPRFMHGVEVLHYDENECVWWRTGHGSGSVFFLVAGDGHACDASLELRGRIGSETQEELIRFKQRVEGTREQPMETPGMELR